MTGVAELVSLATILFFVSIWLGLVLYLRFRRQRSLVYLLFFTIFYAYLYKVLDYTLFQFQSLILLKYLLPDLMLNGQADGEAVNLLPLLSLDFDSLKTSLLNILLFVPFGFGLPFITSFRFKRVLITGVLVSIAIELIQFITGYLAGITFRVADINDVLFNGVGVVIGYVLFVGFVHTFRQIFHTRKNPISQYIAERPQLDT